MSRLKIVFVYVLCLLTFVSVAQAEEVTPSHVYQVANTAERELHHILTSMGKRVTWKGGEGGVRRPRHVLQKAREVFSKLQKLHFKFGVKAVDVPPLSAGRVLPADVKQQLDVMLVEIRGLKKIYAVEGNVEPAGYRGGRRPTDVYRKLAQISGELDVLLETAVKPGDVYRCAVTVRKLLEAIYAEATGGGFLNLYVTPALGKSPRDVFLRGYMLLEKLRKLEQQGVYGIDGGIGEVARRAGHVAPTDVLDLMNIILADVNAMTLEAGVKHVTELVPYEDGIIPSDVYSEISKSILIVDALL